MAATWTPPATVTEGGTQYSFGQDVGPGGDGIVVWSAPSSEGGYAVFARTVGPGGELGARLSISSLQPGSDLTSSYAPTVRYDASGTATVVWIESSYSGEGCIVEGGEAGGEPSCEVNEYVKARQVGADESLGAEHVLYHRHASVSGEGQFGGGGGYATYGQPSLAAGPGETLTVVWPQSSFGSGCAAYGYSRFYADDECEADESIRWVRLSAGGVATGEPKPIYEAHTTGYGSGQPLLHVRLGAAADGTATVLFSARSSGEGTSCWGGESSIGYLRIGADGTATAAHQLDSGCGVTTPDLAVDAAGTAFAAWGWEGNYSGDEALLARISPAGVAETPQTLLGSEAGANVAGIDIARRGGAAFAVWAVEGSIESRSLPLSGALGPIETLVAPATHHYLAYPRIAVAPDDSALIAWEDGTDYGGGGELSLQALSLEPDGTPGSSHVLMAANGWDHGARVAAGSDGAFMASWRVSVPRHNRIQSERLSDASVGSNDDFADAEPITPELPAFSAGSNEGATKEPGEPNHAGDPGGASVWYSWTPDASGPVTLSSCATGALDPVLAVYTGTSLGVLTEVGSAKSGAPVPCSEGDSAVRFNAVAGTTYRIAVDGSGGSEGAFGLKIISRGAGPANDDFAQALALSESGYRYGSNVDGSKQPGEPDHAGNSGGASVWYGWTAPRTAPATIWLCGEILEGPLLGVYTGSAVDSLTPVGASPSPSLSCADGSEVRFNAVAGTTYRIAVDGKDGREGSFQLGVAEQPANDNFGNPQTLPAWLPASSYGSTIAATKEAGEPDHAGDPGGASVWYSWTPTSSGRAFLSACLYAGSEHGALLAVYTGSSLEHLVEVAAAAASGSSCSAEVAFDFDAGTTYRIAVDGKGGGAGSFSLNLEGLPGNDNLAQAQSLGGAFPQFIYGSNRHATKEPGEPEHAGDPGGASVWFKWTPTSSGTGFVSACLQREKSALLGIYTSVGGTGGSASEVVYGDEAPEQPAEPTMSDLAKVGAAVGNGPKAGCSSRVSEVPLDFVAGTTYYIAVDGKEGAEGSFTLSFESPPANDDFAHARSLTAPQQVSGSNRHATKEPGEPDHAGDPGGASVWYSWTPTENGHGTASVCGSFGSVPLLAVYSGADVSHLTPVGVAGTGGSVSGCYSGVSKVEFDVEGGKTYHLAVDGPAGIEGQFTLELAFERSALNDDFASPQQLDWAGDYSGTTRDATKEPGEPEHAGDPGGASVWYSWTPTESGAYGISICSLGSLDPLLAIYTGSSLGSLTPVASNHGGSQGNCGHSSSEARFEAVAGTTYRIAVDGKDGSGGQFDLELSPAPENDQFSEATVLSAALPDYDFETNRFASKEPGEPNHAGDPGGASVWYSWTAEASGVVEVSVCSYLQFEPLIGVYTGSAPGGLSAVTGTPSTPAESCSGAAGLRFEAVAGTTYRIAVDGKGGDQGSFSLALRGRPANDAFAAATPLDAALPAYFYGDNRLATKEAGEPEHAGDPGGASVWFKWTPTSSGPVEISTCPYGVDTLLAVYTGSALGSLQTVAANDDGGSGCSTGASATSFEAVAGTTYRIAVDGKGGSAGAFELRLRHAPPANDDFANAIEIPQEPTSVAGTTLDATAQSGEEYWGQQSVWYKLVAQESGTVRLHTCSDVGTPMGISVFTGSSLGGLSPVATEQGGTAAQCDFSPGLTFFQISPVVAFHAIAGTTYRISVDRYEQISPVFERRPAGPFLLVVDPPANDLRSSPEAIPNESASLERSNVGATREAGEGAHAGDPGGASVWFKWLAQADGPARLDTCGSGIDTLIAVEASDESAVASNDDSDECGPGSTASSVSFEAEEGETYLIAVDGKGGATGPLHLNLGFDTPDTTAPETNTYIPSAINTSQLTLSALRDEPGSSYECALDGAPFASCETEGADQSVTIKVKNLAEGSHTLAVREVDQAGNADPTPVTGTFVVDKTPPETSIDYAPESPTRELGPFDFSADEPSSFECWIDSAMPAYCDTPFYAPAGLADGDHVLHVRAIDRAGNVDATPLAEPFHLDRTPPVVGIDDGPVGTIETSAAKFEFSANEPSTFSCSLDEGPEDECASPRDLTGLTDRDHVFSVTATDAAGNESATLTRSFHVESRPPQTSITSGPPAYTASTSAEFEFAADEETTAFECSLDGEPFELCESWLQIEELPEGHHLLAVQAIDTAGKTDPTPATRAWTVDALPPDTEILSGPKELSPEAFPEFTFGSDETVSFYECSIDGEAYVHCPSPWRSARLTDGAHTISVRAVDLAGNVDPTPVKRSWSIDATPPETTIDSGPSGTVNTNKVTFVYSGSPAADVVRFECRLDNGPIGNCPSGSRSYSSLPDGKHTFWVRAVDAVGNVDGTPAEQTFTVEATPPDTLITSAPGDFSSAEATFQFISSESGSSFECSLDDMGYSPCESPLTLTGLSEGKHWLEVRAVDPGGLTDETPDTWSWTADTAPPETSIDSGPPAIATSTTARFEFSAAPPDDVSGFECSLDEAPFEPCSPDEPYSHLAHTEHTFRVRAIDLVGNVDQSPASRSWTVDPSGDVTPPDTEITGGPPSLTGWPTAAFEFSSNEDDSTFRCSFDGGSAEECSSPYFSPDLATGSHTFSVAAVDPAGNEDPTPAEASFEVDLTKPDVELGATPSSGAAPLAVDFSVAASDSRGRQLHYVLEYGDGAGTADVLPTDDLHHVYKHPGIYLAVLTVTNGLHTNSTFQEVTVAMPEPLQADAGDDQTVVVGEPVHFDAGNSRPQIGITGYRWDLGDGTTAEDKTVDHAYSAPGFYEVELEARAGDEVATDKARIHVLPDTAPHLDASVSGGGSPLGNATVTIIDADGRRFSGSTDSTGHAVIHGLPDGSYTVYASHPGYIDTSAQATVTGGTGNVAISLDPGEVAAASVSSERLNLEQIEALGIDPNDPQNQNVYEFLITLSFSHTNRQFRGYLHGGGGSGGGGGGGFGMETYAHGSWEPCGAPCYSDGWWVYPVWDEGPILEALKIPGKASFLKEFFSVEMLVQNLAGPGISLTHGKASLQLPAGLSLAPTATPQTLVQTLPDIPSGHSATARWTIRGDEEGSYTPTAYYSGMVEPTGHPVCIQATLPEPLKVWGGSALKMLIQPEDQVERYRPYRVKIGLKNVSDVPVYNPAVELFREGKLNYIYQPRERLQQGAPVVEPGQTFWTDDYVLVPAITGKLEPDYSFVKKTGGNVDLEDEIQPVAQKPVAGARLHPLKDSMVLEFQTVQGAQSYEIYRTSPELDEEFPEAPLPAKWLGPTKAVVPAPSSDGAGLFAISTVKAGGIHTLYHKTLVGSSLDYWPTPVTHLDYKTDCTSPVSDLTFHFEDPDFDLAKYHIEIEGHSTLEGTIPPSKTVSQHISGLIDGTKVVAWATNSEQEAEGKGEHGPTLEREISGCRYVALGDSFSSGEGNPPFEDGTDVEGEDTCHRSSVAYPHLLAQGLPDSWAPMIFRACSGAKIEDVLHGDQGGFHFKGEDEGPQIKYLDHGVQLVTLSIGGNNAHFKEILEQCIGAGAVSELASVGLNRVSQIPIGKLAREFIPACKPFWAHRVDTAIKALEQQLPVLYEKVKSEIDKNGKVIILPYPQLFPGGRSECWGMAPSDVAWLHDVEERANEAIRKAAFGRATVADLGDRFAGHDVCTLGDRWFNGPMVYYRNGGVHFEYSFHPNQAGQEALADAANEALTANPPGSATHIDPEETVTNTVQMDEGIASGVFATSWEGSTVETTLVAPSGRRIPADSTDADVNVAVGANYDVFTIEDPEPGTWKIENFGSDIPDGGETLRFESHQIHTENEAPEALFTTSASHGPPPSLTVKFDGAQSFDPDGKVVSYSWDFGDGATGSGPEPTHTYGAGAFHPVLTVTDNEGRTSSYEGETIAVADPPPVADDRLRTPVGETLELDAPGLLANDGGSSAAQLAVAGSEETQHGTVNVHADGSLTYTPNPGFTGTDEFKYVATDGDGLLSSPAKVTIKVKAVPETMIDSGPSGLTASSSPSFTYSARPGVEGARFECRLDQEPFAPCSDSGTSFEHVPDGPHTFAVRAVDGEGEADATPATRSFTVDSTAPETTIDSGPSGLITDPSPSFAFSSNEPGSSFKCRVDAGPATSCTSPKTLTSLGEGPHSFEVGAIDPAGNPDPTPAVRSFTITQEAPPSPEATGSPSSAATPATPPAAIPPPASLKCKKGFKKKKAHGKSRCAKVKRHKKKHRGQNRRVS
jgi:PKD domain/Bacterial Ig domain/Carboxypeptidase regulatory-like domain